MSYFNPLDLQRTYTVVRDFARHNQVQVYLPERAARLPMAKYLGEVLAFDHREAQDKAQRMFAA